MNQWQDLSLRLDSLVLFRDLVQTPPLSALADLLRSWEKDTAQRLRAYSSLVSELYARNCGLSQLLLQQAVRCDTLYLRRLGCGEPISPELARCLEQELTFLQQLADLTCQDLQQLVAAPFPLPDFSSARLDFPAEYRRGTAQVQTRGWGIFAEHTMFYLEGDQLVPAVPADRTRLADLNGYTRERRQVLDNTLALIRGLPASNALLYGDAGTGKSSTVKAVTNELAGQGLRLIELRKHQLKQLPRLMARLQHNPLKFIVFLDDLSFQSNDDDFSTLKAILEGSSCVRASNVVIYATSNRRHLVRETFSDREGDDIHRRDSIQETLSLADRFGMSVLFSVPGKALYLQIVHALAVQKGIEMNVEELDRRAEVFALEKGGRSPRAAEQFTNALLRAECGEDLPC